MTIADGRDRAKCDHSDLLHARSGLYCWSCGRVWSAVLSAFVEPFSRLPLPIEVAVEGRSWLELQPDGSVIGMCSSITRDVAGNITEVKVEPTGLRLVRA